MPNERIRLMSDVIIAIVPAPGHEGLVAEGPMGERPALLVQTGDGHWIDGQHVGPFAGSDVVTRALVLHAPGDPRLGMIRAMYAGNIHHVSTHLTSGGDGEACDYGGGDWYDVAVPPWEGCGRHWSANEAYVVAHLLLQRGIASEVLVLPVTP